MSYIKPFLILALFSIHLDANAFEHLNLPLNEKMLENKKNAQPCKSPALAEKSFLKNFHYGCFCGKNYPKIEHPSHKKYQKLNLSERQELISEYYKIKPSDDIDKVCMQHDICYLSQGKKAQTCNDSLYKELKKIKYAFRNTSKRKEPHIKRCRHLSTDMALAFKTVFTLGEDFSISKLFTLSLSTPFSLSSGFIHSFDYPKEDERCNLLDLK